MVKKSQRAVVFSLFATALAGSVASVASASDLWFHVRVEEAQGAKVSVNLPLALVEKAAAFIPKEHRHHVHFDHSDIDFDIHELRELWAEVRNGPDMTFVTVEETDETVKVWKQNGSVFVEVRGSDDERVDVKVPIGVVDALLAGDEVNIRAAAEALVAEGEGQFVEVRDHNDSVRIWVDGSAEGS